MLRAGGISFNMVLVILPQDIGEIYKQLMFKFIHIEIKDEIILMMDANDFISNTKITMTSY